MLADKHLTEKDLLIQSDINTSFLTDWKKGRVKAPSYDKLLKIANTLEVSLDWLIKGEETSNNLSDKEKYILKMYRELDTINKTKIEGVLEYMLSNVLKNNRIKSSDSQDFSNEEFA